MDTSKITEAYKQIKTIKDAVQQTLTQPDANYNQEQLQILLMQLNEVQDELFFIREEVFEGTKNYKQLHKESKEQEARIIHLKKSATQHNHQRSTHRATSWRCR
ncbi:hypothetical protein [Photobacterium damselae]|uniref:hypothetical protein n=1 Tax=Photobacterium damselae TaxID=38293 RepID=UPI001EFC770B|nr:hypothetical protein [Photobacterium damselae]MCG9780302.1 hypothetical protein [Photobacterium damselae]